MGPVVGGLEQQRTTEGTVGIAVAAVHNESSDVNLSVRDRSRSSKFTSFDGKLVLGALVATLWSVVIVHFFSAFIAGTL